MKEARRSRGKLDVWWYHRREARCSEGSSRTPHVGLALLSVLTAMLASTLVNVVVAPALVRGLNGYWPDLSYQRVSPGILSEASTMIGGFHRLGDHVSLFFGGLPGWCVAIGVTTLLVLAGRRRRGAARASIVSLFVAGVVLVGLLALLLALMERRLSALSEVEEWQYFYYYIALTPWFVVRTLLCLQWLAALGQRVRAAVIVCLVVMALGNLHSLYRCGQRMWSFRTLSAYADQMDRLRSAPPEPMSPQQARQALARCGAEPAYDRTLTNVSAQGWCERYNLLYWRILTRKLRRP